MNRIGFLFSIVLALVLFSCQNESKSDEESSKEGIVSSEIKTGGSLNIALSNPSAGINPKFIYSFEANEVATMIFETIVKFNPKTLKIEPLIAENFEIADSNKTFVFTIRKGVFFHNDECFANGKGRELTPEDIKYSYEYYCTPENGEMSPAYHTVFANNVEGLEDFVSGKADGISGIQIDGNKIIIKLTHSNSDFLKQLAATGAAIVPKEVVECNGIERGIGTGPFLLASISEKKVTFVKNPNYYLKDTKGNQLPYLDTVNFKVIPSKIDQLISFEETEIDFIDGLPSGKIKYMVEENIRNFDEVPPKYVLAHEPQLNVEYYGFNLTKRQFKDKRVRQAISYAINRQTIYDKILKRQAYSPGQAGLVPPIKLFKGYDFNKVQEYSYSYNPEKAKKLMAEAGYPNGKGFPKITIEYNQKDLNYKVAAEIQDQLKSVLNIDLQIEAVSFDQKIQNANYAKSDMYRAAWIGDYPSPQTMLSIGYGKTVPNSLDKPSHPNSMRFVNTEFDKLYEAAIKANSEEERYKLYSDAESILMDEAPIVVLWYYEDNQILHSYVRNMNYNAIKHVDFREVWIKDWTEEEYKEFIKK
jgi:ABC-type transport system substrate-binding protein